MRLALVTQNASLAIADKPQLMAQGLLELGHEVHFICTSIPAARERAYRDQDPAPKEIPGISRHLVPSIDLGRDLVLSTPFDSSYRGRYDAVLLHEDYPPLSKFAYLWARHEGVPVGILFERYYYPDSAPLSFFLRILDHSVHPLMWKGSALLLYHSKACREFFSDRGAPKATGHHLPGFIDAEYFGKVVATQRAASPRAETDTTLINCVGRLTPYKGQDVLLRATQLLRRKGRRIQVRLIGRGPTEPGLRRMVNDLDLGDVARVDTTYVPPADVPLRLASADLYVQPSRIEPFGLATVEAMACGLPVIASSVGGLADSVVDGVTGLLVPPDDPVRLAEALDALVQDPQRAREMGRRGAERARAELDYRVVCRRLDALLRGVTS